MRQPAGNLILTALAVCALAACSNNKPDEVNPNIFPTNYKNEILQTLTTTLIDPTNVRDAFLSDPALTTINQDQRYTACVRYNPRDANRNYMGTTVRIAYFYGGHLNQLVEAAKDQCGNAAYKPFPELEKLCLSNKCS
jgi:hypothetical protein